MTQLFSIVGSSGPFVTITVTDGYEAVVELYLVGEIRSRKSDNLIPGMAAACRWDVESGKLKCPSTCGHVPICV
jgi:hypothetical protein